MLQWQRILGLPREIPKNHTPLKFNMVPERWWLEDYFPFWNGKFSGAVLNFQKGQWHGNESWTKPPVQIGIFCRESGKILYRSRDVFGGMDIPVNISLHHMTHIRDGRTSIFTRMAGEWAKSSLSLIICVSKSSKSCGWTTELNNRSHRFEVL